MFYTDKYTDVFTAAAGLWDFIRLTGKLFLHLIFYTDKFTNKCSYSSCWSKGVSKTVG